MEKQSWKEAICDSEEEYNLVIITKAYIKLHVLKNSGHIELS